MDENQNYIGIAFGADVSDLKSGLALMEKQISNSTKDFEKATVGMGDWQKSIEGVEAKTKQLSDILVAQSKKLAGLKAEYKKVADEQGASSEAALRLQQQIKRQQTIVNATQREYINYSDTLDKARKGTIDLAEVSLKGGKAIKNIGDSADESAKDLKNLGDGAQTASDNVNGGFGKAAVAGIVGGIAAIGAAAVAAVGGFLSLAESTREAREDMAKLTSAYEGAGLTVDSANKTFTQLYSVIGETDTAVEAAQQIALLAESEEEAAKWAGIAAGVTATFGDALKPEMFYESANETLKLGEATGGFVQMLEGTGVNVDEFNAHLASLNTEQEKQAYMLQISQQMMGEAGKAYEETAGDIMAAREAEAQLSLAMQELGAIAEPIMTTLKLLAVDLLGSMTPFVELIGTGLKGAFEGTAGATDTLAQGLSGILSLVAEKAVQILPTLLSVLASLISTLLPSLIAKLGEIIPILLQTFAAQLPIVLQAIISAFSQILTTIGGMLPTLIPLVIDAVLTITETLLDNIDQLIDAGILLLMGLADGLIVALPRLIDKIPVIIDKLMSAFSRNGPKLIQAGISLLVKLAAGLIQAIPQLIAAIPEIIASLVSGFGEYYSEMGEVGLDIVKGIWEGITGGADWLKEKISGFAGNVADWFKETFKIGSPSKLIEDEVGVYVGQGIVPTRQSALAKVKKTLGGFTDYVADNLGGIKGNLALEGVGGGGVGASRVGGNSTVINAGMTVNYNGNLSRKQLKRIENDNYTAIRTRLRTEGI